MKFRIWNVLANQRPLVLVVRKRKPVNLVISLESTSTFIPQHPRTLIADDEPDILTALRLLLKGDGYEPETVSSPAAVLEALDRWRLAWGLFVLTSPRATPTAGEGIDLISR